MKPLHREALDYIRNTGGSPKVQWFDDDFEPIGPNLRADMLALGLITEQDGLIRKVD